MPATVEKWPICYLLEEENYFTIYDRLFRVTEIVNDAGIYAEDCMSLEVKYMSYEILKFVEVKVVKCA